MRFFSGDKESCAQRRFRAAAVGIVLFGLALRLLYVSVVKVDFPIRGDINQYVL